MVYSALYRHCRIAGSMSDRIHAMPIGLFVCNGVLFSLLVLFDVVKWEDDHRPPPGYPEPRRTPFSCLSSLHTKFPSKTTLCRNLLVTCEMKEKVVRWRQQIPPSLCRETRSNRGALLCSKSPYRIQHCAISMCINMVIDSCPKVSNICRR
jgi:hypothetical protein